MTMNRYARVSAGVLVLAAGSAASAQNFVFAPACGPFWYQECSGAPCINGGFVTSNNWGYVACTGGLPTPGAGNDTYLGANAVNLNSTASVASLWLSPGGSLDWSAGSLSLATQFTNDGSVIVQGGDKNLAGGVVNNGAWNNVGSWTVYFYGASFANNSLLQFVDKNFTHGGSANFISNGGTLRKTSGAQSGIYSIPVTHSGVFDLQGGVFHFNNLALTSTAGASWASSPATTLALENLALSGTFNAAIAGDAYFSANLGIPSNTTFNFSGNGLRWNDSALTIAPGATLTNATTGIITVNGGDKNFAGAVVNNGTWNNTGAWTVYFYGATFTNNALLQFYDKNFTLGGGSNSISNTGTLRKTSGSQSGIYSIPVAHSGAFDLQGGGFHFNSLALTSTPGASWTTALATTLAFEAAGLSGTFNAAIAGDAYFSANLSIPSNTTFNFSGNGLRWNDSGLTIAPGATLTNAPAGIITVNGGDKNFTGAVVNNGTWNNAGAWTVYFYGATFTNNALLQFVDKNFSLGSGSNSISNSGTLRKTSGSQSGIYSIPVAQSGVFDLQGGGFHFNNLTLTSTPGASWATSPATSLAFEAASLSGTFNAAIAGDAYFTANLGIPVDTTFNFSGNGLRWNDSGLSIAAGVTLTNATAGIITVNGGDKNFTGAVVNNGTWNNVGGWSVYFYNAAVSNAGTLHFVDKNFTHGAGVNSVLNSGTLRKSSGSACSITAIPLTNSGLLTVEAGNMVLNCPFSQTSGGLTSVDAGATLSGPGGLDFAGGALKGAGAIAANVTNSGATVAPGSSPGVLTIQGSYAQQSGGTLSIEIGGLILGTQYDRLTIAGNATLSGSLSVSLINGYAPNVGDTFTILTTGGTVSGTFLAATPGWDVHYDTNYVSITRNRPVYCPADIATAGNPDPLSGPDGFVTGEDFDAFIVAYFKELRNGNNVLVADLCDGLGQTPPDGFVTGVDFDFFVLHYFMGC